MTSGEMQRWLHSGQSASIDGLDLRPRPHPFAPGTPFSISRGQAAAFYLLAADGGQWIIKKFHPGRSPDARYLGAVRGVIPEVPAFTAGHQRRVLSANHLRPAHRDPALARWLDGTVLMPKIDGVDWAAVADKLRAGDIALSGGERLRLVLALAGAVHALEEADCAHRDLSTGNLYLWSEARQVALIDWDSAFHPSLTMPANTTCGSTGYMAPFVWVGDNVDPALTWGPGADRFALAVCCVEFLLMDRGAPFHGDGGMFDQEDLRRRRGATIDAAQARLRRDFPDAAGLFARALSARAYLECPSPGSWEAVAASAANVALAPQIDQLPVTDLDFAAFLVSRTPPPPIWPAPPLPPAPLFPRIDQPAQAETVPSAPILPPDPWKDRRR